MKYDDWVNNDREKAHSIVSCNFNFLLTAYLFINDFQFTSDWQEEKQESREKC